MLFKYPQKKVLARKKSAFQNSAKAQFTIYRLVSYPMYIGYTRQKGYNRWTQHLRDVVKRYWWHKIQTVSDSLESKNITLLDAVILTTKEIKKWDKKEKTRNRMFPITNKKIKSIQSNQKV